MRGSHNRIPRVLRQVEDEGGVRSARVSALVALLVDVCAARKPGSRPPPGTRTKRSASIRDAGHANGVILGLDPRILVDGFAEIDVESPR